MNIEQVRERLSMRPCPPGRVFGTIFFGRATYKTVNALSEAGKSGALIIFIHEEDATETVFEYDGIFAFPRGRTGEMRSGLKAIFDYFGMEEGFQLRTMSESGCERLLTEVRPLVLDILSDLKFARRSGMLHLRCVLENSRLISTMPSYTLERAKRGSGAVICCGGPSLTGQLEELRRLGGKLFIMAVGRAAMLLQEAGLEPDLVVEIDAESVLGNAESRQSFTCPLAAVPIVSPLAARRFGSFVWYGESEGNTAELLRELRGGLPEVHLSRSVVLTALDIAIKTGFDHIALIGSELSLGSGGELHAGEMGNNGDGAIKVPGNEGTEVISTPSLLGIKEALEEYIAICGHEVWNCTTGGALIAGCRRGTLNGFAAMADESKKPGFIRQGDNPLWMTMSRQWRNFRISHEYNSLRLAVEGVLGKFVAGIDRFYPGREDFERELLDDLGGDLKPPERPWEKVSPYRYNSFMGQAERFVALRNPEYAEYLSGLELVDGAPGFRVKPWLQSIPQVELSPGGVALTPGENREHAAYEEIRRFCEANAFNPAGDAVIFINPGDWHYPAEFARCHPDCRIAIIDPNPRLFRLISSHALFTHVFNEHTLVLGAVDELRSWRRQLHAWERDMTRKGFRILRHIHPILGDIE